MKVKPGPVSGRTEGVHQPVLKKNFKLIAGLELGSEFEDRIARSGQIRSLNGIPVIQSHRKA